jgi:hypothetical protein
MASCKGAAMPARRHCQANHTIAKQGAQFKWEGQQELSFGSKNVCCGSLCLLLWLAAAYKKKPW